jgi:hypothetical protein
MKAKKKTQTINKIEPSMQLQASRNAQGHIARVLTRQETLVSVLYPFSNFSTPTIICTSLRQTSILLFTLVIISNFTTGDQKASDIH